MNAEQIKILTEAIELKCTDDLVDYLAARAYLAAWAVEAVNGSRYTPYLHGVIPEGRIIDDDTVQFLLVAMEFSHIDELVKYANEAIVQEWQRVRSDLDLTWQARVFEMVNNPEYKAIGIDTVDYPGHPRQGWLAT
jgi:hypothetical protein